MTFTVIDDPGYRMSPSFSRKKGICGTYRNITRSFPRMSSAVAPAQQHRTRAPQQMMAHELLILSLLA
jgi:hypothetical protein